MEYNLPIPPSVLGWLGALVVLHLLGKLGGK
jgi:hypothetical protein